MDIGRLAKVRGMYRIPFFLSSIYFCLIKFLCAYVTSKTNCFQ
jgi:hypothetical protein